MSETWLLFEDASHDAVQCSLYPLPKDYPRPVDAYIVFEHSGDFTIAAQKAVHAVFDLVRKRSIPVQPVNAGFDLAHKTRLDAGMAGQSGGLCFALAFAKKLLNLDLPDLAATGIISSDGRISPVNGIEAKLRTALTLLNENDLIFFPEDNQSQIPDSLITQIKHKNIRLHPVATLEQVMDILTGKAPPGLKNTRHKPYLKKSPQTSRRLTVLIIIFMAACLFAGFQLFGKKPVSSEITERPVLESHELPMRQKETIPTPEAEPSKITATQDTTKKQSPEKPVTDHKGFD